MRTILSVLVSLAISVLVPALSFAQAGEGNEKGESEESILERGEFFRRQRMGTDGQNRTTDLLRAKQDLDSRFGKIAPAGPADAGIWNWEYLGPGNLGGRARSLIIHPTKPDTMWLGSAQGGIWRTTDGGQDWTPMTDFFPSLACVSLAIDPNNPQVLYAGTGEFVGSNGLDIGVGMEHAGAGIFKSTTGGVLWTQLPSTDSSKFYFVSRLEHHPRFSNELLAATMTGVWRTTDGGSQWSQIFATAPNEYAMDVKYDPGNTSRIMIGTVRFPGAHGDVYLRTELVRGGVTLDTLTRGGAGNLPISPGECEITFTPGHSRIMYVSIGKYKWQGKGEVWRSNDGGQTWKLWWKAISEESWPDAWSNALWVSPTDTNLVVFGGMGDLYRCPNAGSSGLSVAPISDWRQYSTDNSFRSAHGDQHAIVSHPNYDGVNNSTVFVVNDGGVQKATDIKNVTTTTGWTNLANYMGIAQFLGGAASPDGNLILGGAQDLGLLRYRQSDGTESWRLSATGDGAYCAVNQVNSQICYITYPRLAIVKSTNGGQTFFDAVNGLSESTTVFLAPMVMDPNYPDTLVAGGRQIWRTTNGAGSWAPISNPLTGDPACTAIDIAPSNSSVIWVGYENGTVAHTTNGGSSWTIDGKPGGTRFVTDIAVNPKAWNEVFVTVGGYDTNTVWYTNTTGASWHKRNGAYPNNLPPIQVYTIRYHPLMLNWIYVGTDLGVFASEDKGLTWSITPRYQSGEGPNYTEVKELFWQGTSYLVAATHGRGMWRCKPLPIVYVDKTYTGTDQDGSEFRPYNTVQQAVDSYGPGAMISIKSNMYDEPALTITKRGIIRSTNGVVIIK